MSLRLSESEYADLLRKTDSGIIPESVPADRIKKTAAIARITGGPAYKSKLEAKWAVIGPTIVSEQFGTPVVRTMYEPFSLNLSGGSYTPDFLHLLSDGRIVVVETKGSRYIRSTADSRSKFRAAAVDFSMFYFVWVDDLKEDGLKFERFDPYGKSGVVILGGYAEQKQKRKTGGRKNGKLQGK